MNDHTQDRRESCRFKIRIPIEIETEGSSIPIRGATADLSAGGCYIETMFPFPVGTVLDLKLQLENTLLVAATVVTCDPQVGNGIRFEKMLPEDREELQKYLQAQEQPGEGKPGAS
ncbi:MAG: PilZ domain-containing protein [Terriglobales bacterium]